MNCVHNLPLVADCASCKEESHEDRLKNLVAQVVEKNAAAKEASDALLRYMDPIVKKSMEDGGDVSTLVLGLPESVARFTLWQRYIAP